MFIGKELNTRCVVLQPHTKGLYACCVPKADRMTPVLSPCAGFIRVRGGGLFRTGGRGVKGVQGLCHTHLMTTTFYQIACPCDSQMYPYSTGVVVEWCVAGLLHRIIINLRRWFVYVCGAGLICVTEVAPHWSKLRNSMIMRIYYDVRLGLTTAHWSEKS